MSEPEMKRSQSSFWRNETAAAAALYALALPALVAVAGIAFDYARLAAMDTELQNAADQAALAAATQLDRRAGAISRGNAAATLLIGNESRFANDGQGRDVSDLTVRFYANQAQAETCGAAGALAETAFAQAAFVCVQVNTRTANYALTPVVGALRGDIFAQAVAGVGSALCRTPPLMLCNPSEPPSGNVNADFDANSYKGVGLLAKGGGGSSWAPGNFGFVDTFPGTGGGTPDLMKAFAWDSTPGTCISQSGNTTIDSEPGNVASVADAINMRFDIYDGACPSGGNCPASVNSVKDAVHPNSFSGNQACKLHNQGWRWPSGAYQPVDPNNPLPLNQTPTVMGHPRDMCHAVSENGSCAGGPFGNGAWDRDAYFRTNYPAWTNGDGTSRWRTNTGLSASATRYEVYKWEIGAALAGSPVDGQVVLGSRAISGSLSSYGRPQCGASSTPTATTADRRRLSVAVVNCVGNNVRGNSTGVPVRRWIDVFLVEPSLDRGSRTKKDQIYVEIVGETTSGAAGETAGSVIRRDVPHLVK
ncbi:Putative Flp pilus-assembly TadE/G-like [Sphingopyxis sp. YR583]|uniref:pilus assembly protein TadG-related protein n=1 Tax=Sphingopyxis sp. YR583 TaxID=1881047 RepID=UPI0008A725C2|nr:pilus assembly protein TadG-related protein [Sphingopyxis sp. YR583]SEH20077.1 Putative Flp pilus-assembly TadE/G-like [Sphingopyxis sp. YR583]